MYTLTFGPYENLTIREISKIDLEYLILLRDTNWLKEAYYRIDLPVEELVSIKNRVELFLDSCITNPVIGIGDKVGFDYLGERVFGTVIGKKDIRGLEISIGNEIIELESIQVIKINGQ